MLKNLVQSTQNCNTVSRQCINDVSSQLVAVHKLKIGHCRNLFIDLIEYLECGDITCHFFPSVKAISCSVTLRKFCNVLCAQPNTLKSNQPKKCHIDIYVKTKNWSSTCSEVLTESSAAFIPSIQLTFTQLY